MLTPKAAVPVRAAIRASLLLLGGAVLSLAGLSALHSVLATAPVLQFDSAVQAFVHGAARPWLTVLMLTFTWMGAIRIFLVAAGAVVVGLWFTSQRRPAVTIAVALAGALLLNTSLKLHFHRLRPAVPWAIGDASTFSFPSGHALFSTTLYATLACLALPHARSTGRRLAIVLPAVLLPLTIGLSRVYLGMHFPTDVLAGYLCGTLWAGSVMLWDRAVFRR